MAPPSSVRQSQSTKEERSEYPKLRAIYQHVLRDVADKESKGIFIRDGHAFAANAK